MLHDAQKHINVKYKEWVKAGKKSGLHISLKVFKKIWAYGEIKCDVQERR